MALFREFKEGSLALNSLNFGTITLLLKSKEANQIQQYKPICVLNVTFNFFTKVVTNKITKVAKIINKPSKTTFLPSQNIMHYTLRKKWYSIYNRL
jgi:hypothetical protein